MTTIEAPNPSLTSVNSPSGAMFRAPLGRLASVAVGACVAGALLPAIAHTLTGAALPDALSLSGMGVGIAAAGALLGLLTFAILGARSIFTWSMIVIGESAIRLALTLGLAALIAIEIAPDKLPFWGGYLLASLGVLVAWTLTFCQRLLAAEAQSHQPARADSESA